MKIDINDPQQILSHVLLDSSCVDDIACSVAWTEHGEVNCKVLMNDIEVPAEDVENSLQRLFNQVEKHYREKYNADSIDDMVEQKARELLKNQADNVLEILGTLQSTLEDSESLIKPHWER